MKPALYPIGAKLLPLKPASCRTTLGRGAGSGRGPAPSSKPSPSQGQNGSGIPIERAADSIPQGKPAFRRTVQVREDAALTGALFAFSVDKQGECYCNGEPIGPSGPWQSGAAYSLLPYLHPGDNLIAVEGNNLFEGYAGFAGKLLLTYDDGQQDVVVTDRDWKTSDTPGQGWILPGYDDAGWNSPDQALEHGCEPWGAVEVNASPMEPSPAPLLRREFTLQGRVQKARAYVCGLGLFDLWINGGRPDDTVLNPAHTQYDRRVFYRVFDITALLREGANAAALELGNSFFNETIWVWNWPNAAWRDYPKCRVELTVWYEDGRCETIASDRSWKVTLGWLPLCHSVYYGETVDARGHFRWGARRRRELRPRGRPPLPEGGPCSA